VKPIILLQKINSSEPYKDNVFPLKQRNYYENNKPMPKREYDKGHFILMK